MDNLLNKFSKYVEEVSLVFRKPVVSVLPGHLSFFLLLSIVPITIIFGVIAGTFSVSYDGLVDFIALSLPGDISKLILPLFVTQIPDISLTFLIISAIFLASRGTKAIILTANNIYSVNRNWLLDTIKSIIITVLLVLLIIFITIILVLGGKILNMLGNISGISFITANYLSIINIVRWPLSVLVIFFTLKVIYTLTPNKKISSKSVNKGSVFTTLSWIIITYIYSFYVFNYASYNTYYGSASNIIVLMLWIYLISRIFVIGMIINSLEDKRERSVN